MNPSSNNTVNVSRSYFNMLGSASALACALMLSACQGGGSVNGQVDLIDMRSEELLSSDLASVNGTYGAGCTNRSGAWSLEIEVGATLDNDPLSVVLNNDACVLTMTELHTIDGALAAVPAVVLTTSYNVIPSAFDDPVAFYGNAKMSSVSFASDFVLTVLYSDDPSLATDDNTATFEVIQASAMGDSVAAPDYLIDIDGINAVTDADQVVVSATGSVALTAGLVSGQTYVVVDASGLDTYAELDAAYLAGSPAAVGASVPAADFTLVGEDLDALPKRTLIIANIEGAVASYQAFEITFHPATVL
ncbi:MAG: hypothetical protein H0T76_04240 [Nannocystis sp.]|nr:hypothetical protein [Nannocystis sp.]MBA3545671.1 hypothetical protein [Nannocystis sp.]